MAASMLRATCKLNNYYADYHAYKCLRRLLSSSNGDLLSKKVRFADCPDRVFSGIQPTGVPHIGNYLGAIKPWAELQHRHEDIMYSVVNMHSVTVPQDPDILRTNIHEMVCCLIACGIDVNKTTLFLQSDVPEHTGLSWIFSCLINMSRLALLPQWKTKTDNLREVGVGFLTYPVLQSADILLYKANLVPVGEDQVIHVVLTSDIARIFNQRFGLFFPKPEPIIGSAKRVKSLRDPAKKMSKSDKDVKSCILLTDSDDEIRNKFKKAVTDFTSAVTYDPNNRPGVSNMIDIHCEFTGLTPSEVCEQSMGLETAQYKLVVADIVSENLKPIRDEVARLRQDRGYIEQVLLKGAEAAREIAGKNYDDIKQLVGFR